MIPLLFLQYIFYTSKRLWASLMNRADWASTDSMYVCMYVWSLHIARVRINPILLVVSLTGKMDISLSPFAPEYFVSRHGFGSPGPRQPAHLHTQAESGAYLQYSSRVPRRRPFIYQPSTTTIADSTTFVESPSRLRPWSLETGSVRLSRTTSAR